MADLEIVRNLIVSDNLNVIKSNTNNNFSKYKIIMYKWAVYYDKPALLEYLFETFEINSKFISWLLSYAVVLNRYHIAVMIIKNGCDCDCLDHLALKIAACNGNKQLYNLLVSYTNHPIDYKYIIQLAASNGYDFIIKEVVKNSPNVWSTMCPEFNNLLMIWAFINEQYETIELLESLDLEGLDKSVIRNIDVDKCSKYIVYFEADDKCFSNVRELYWGNKFVNRVRKEYHYDSL